MNRIPLIILLFCFVSSAGQVLKKPVPDRLVVLTFDDAPVTHFSFVAPLLKQYGFGASFFVCEFPPNFSDSSKYMTCQQMEVLGKMGFEVANHTHTHANVSKLTTAQLHDQLKYIEDKCDSLGIGIPRSFAYPGYGLNEAVLPVLEQRSYHYARAGGSRPYDPLTDHPYLIPSWATTDSNRHQIMDALQQAGNGKIVVLTIHGVPDYEHPWVTTSPALFISYLDYLKENGYRVVALRDLDEFLNPDQAMRLIKPDFTKPLKN